MCVTHILHIMRGEMKEQCLENHLHCRHSAYGKWIERDGGMGWFDVDWDENESDGILCVCGKYNFVSIPISTIIMGIARLQYSLRYWGLFGCCCMHAAHKHTEIGLSYGIEVFLLFPIFNLGNLNEMHNILGMPLSQSSLSTRSEN